MIREFGGCHKSNLWWMVNVSEMKTISTSIQAKPRVSINAQGAVAQITRKRTYLLLDKQKAASSSLSIS